MSENEKEILPEWFDGKKINEVMFCTEFIRDFPMVTINDSFFTVDGRVSDENRLKKEIYNRIKPYVTSSIAKRITGLLDVMRMECCTEALPLYQDRINVKNGTYFLDGTFSEQKDFCRNRLPVAYNPDAPVPKTWLWFLSELLIPEDIPTLQEFMGYCFIPSTKGQKMEKIQAGSSEFITGRDSILIDLSSWYRESLAPKIETIQDAIGLRKTIRFKYYSPGGDTEREIEPYYLIFKWTSWYVYGYCLLRNDFRLFKLNRMDDITHVASFEENREVPLPDLSSEKVFPAKDRVKALFDPSTKWQLVEEYGVDSFTEQDDGSLLFEHEYADDEGLLSWMLSCRDKVTVLEPERIREKLYQITSEIAKRYEENGHEKQSIGRDRPSE